MRQAVRSYQNVQAVSDGERASSELLNVIPHDAGPRLTTFRGGAVHSIRPPGEQTFTSQNHYAAVILSSSPGMESGYASDRMHKFDAPIGMLVICPAQVESRAIWTARRENVTVALPHTSLLELAQHELDQGGVDLRPIPFSTVDQAALFLAQKLKAELSDREIANELYVDSLITMFGIHILRTYGGRSKAHKPAQGGLPAHKVRDIREFLNENLSRKISVADLAGVCGLSPGHLFRAFAKTFGQSPHQYLINLRLSTAERLLVESDLDIAHIAHLSGFSSQSHLTTAMRRHRNLTPFQARARRY